MQDGINLLMLVCAAAAALAFGVLAAYSLCRVAFALLRFHARSIAEQSLRGNHAAKEAATAYL
jgi:hypothetical protein